MAEYCLRWNNHQPNLVTVFSELLNSEALVDVTLATDGQFIHAHKLVLSACSAYFKDLFGSNPCKHPIVFLKDIRFEDLRTVVDFIYKGEVNVTQDRLQDVLRTAESLKIKGLADRPLSFEEHSSQTRGHPLSSAFSSQRSSLNDSREQLHNLDAEDGVDSRASSSPPTYKKRKITTQENSESVLGNCEETRPVTDNLEKDEETVINPLPETIGDSELSNPSEVKKIKKEDESSHPSEVLPEYQESRAADAMLLLQGSSSETEGGPSASGSSATNNIRGEIASSILGSHSQGRGKRGMLRRQPGIIREIPTEETREESIQPEYILPDNTITVSFSSNSPVICEANVDSNERETISLSTKPPPSPNSKLLQVPSVVVGSHDSAPYSSASHTKQVAHSKSLLVVPTSGSSNQILKQSESRSHQSGSLPITKQSSHPGVLTHTTTMSLERSHSTTTAGSSSGNQVALIPMQLQLVPKQKSSPGSLPSSQSHLRPIQPKPSTNESEFWTMKKEPPVIQFTYTDDDLTYQRLSRAISEEPQMTRMTGFDALSPGPSPLTQSVSQDTGLDASIGISRFAPPTTLSGLNINRSSTGTSSVSHTPVLREGPALGCNYCWNTQDTQGRVQRRKTKYHCPDCRTNLCIVPCFHEYHSQMQIKQDQHKQISKILTKTSSM